MTTKKKKEQEPSFKRYVLPIWVWVDNSRRGVIKYGRHNTTRVVFKGIYLLYQGYCIKVSTFKKSEFINF